MTYAYYYLLGQNIAYYGNTLVISGPALIAVGIIAALATGFSDITITGLILGMLSVVYLTEKKMNRETAIFQFTKDPSAHFHGIVLGLEIILFASLSLMLLVDDGSVTLWLLSILAHGLYIMVTFFTNKASKRIPGYRDAFRFFFVYTFILMFTDAYFLVISLIVHDRRQNIVSIFIVTVLTQAANYFIDRYDIDSLLAPQSTKGMSPAHLPEIDTEDVQ